MILVTKTVSKRIAYYRKKRDLTREELANNVGMNLKHLIRIETGTTIPRISELVQLAAGLDISIDKLVDN